MYSGCSPMSAFVALLSVVGLACAVPANLTSSFSDAYTISGGRSKNANLFPGYYRKDTLCNDPRLLEELPSMYGNEAGMWVAAHAIKYNQFNSMKFKMKESIDTSDPTVELALYENRELSYSRCETAYMILLYNYCLAQDVCDRSICGPPVSSELSDERRTAVGVRLYLNSTAIFLQSYFSRGGDYPIVMIEKYRQAIRARFDEKYKLRDPEECYDEIDGQHMGTTKKTAHVAGPNPPRSGRRQKGFFRGVLRSCCGVTSSDSDGDARPREPHTPTSSSTLLRSKRPARRTYLSSPTDKLLDRDYVLEILSAYEEKLWTLTHELRTSSEYLAFLNTKYRELLGKLLSEIESLAIHLKSELYLPS